MSAIVAIPARLKSTRFPRKVLAEVHGKPMLWYVHRAVSGCRGVSGVYILTDSADVYQAAASWGANVLMTPEDCPSGTARIVSALDSLDADVIVNVQGDEPLIQATVVEKLVEALEGSDADLATPVFRITEPGDVQDPNLVKAVRAADGTALYFSRSPIPYVRDWPAEEWLSRAAFWGHVGLYAYRRSVLEGHAKLPEGQLEGAEKLEQLRLLEAGLRILTVEIDYRPRGVDVPEDLELVRSFLDPSGNPGECHAREGHERSS